MKIVFNKQIKQKYRNNPPVPMKLRRMLDDWTAMKIMKKLKVIMKVLTKDFRSGVNHSAETLLIIRLKQIISHP